MSIGYPTTGEHYGHCPIALFQMNPFITNTICARPSFLLNGVENEARGHRVMELAVPPTGDQALVDPIFGDCNLENIIEEEMLNNRY